MPIPSDSTYMLGRRRVRLSTGEIVSRAEAENIFAQSREGGQYKNNYERRKAVESKGFKDFKKRKGYDRAIKEGRSTGKSKQEVESYLAKFYKDRDRNQTDNSPQGPKAQMLIALGRRIPTAEYRVGES